MSDGNLTKQRCVPCEGGAEPLGSADVERLREQVPAWDVGDGEKLTRELRFRSFPAVIAFVDELAELAEAEGHHPDFSVHYDRLQLTVWTHAIGGLSENDFILAAKLDRLAASAGVVA